jgi:hypothetical protein
MNAKFCMAGSVNTSRRRILMHPSLIYNWDIQPVALNAVYILFGDSFAAC